MAKKKTQKVAPDAATAAENLTDDKLEKAPPKEPETPKETEAAKEPETPKETPKKSTKKKAKLIKVRATKGYLYEPFQLIPLQEGIETPVEDTSWVQCQIEAGLLEKC